MTYTLGDVISLRRLLFTLQKCFHPKGGWTMHGAIKETERSDTPTGCSSCSHVPELKPRGTQPCSAVSRKPHAALPPRAVRLHGEHTESAQHSAVLALSPGLCSHHLEGGPTHRVCTGRCQPPEGHVCSTWDTDKWQREDSKPLLQNPQVPFLLQIHSVNTKEI